MAGSTVKKSTIVRAKYAGVNVLPPPGTPAPPTLQVPPAWNKRSFTARRAAAALGATRLAFSVLERWAPDLGSRWAEQLWLTPPKRPWQPATPVDVEAGEFFDIPLGAGMLRGATWGDGPPVYLVHGWGGRRGQLDAFVGPLVQAGRKVVAFDIPGHGESTPGAAGPRRALLPEFGYALAAVIERFGPACGVIAHSLGSAGVALEVLDGLPVRNLVFINPYVEPITFSHVFARTLDFGERIRTGFLALLEKRVGLPMSVFDIPARVAAKGPAELPRLLVVHDRMDREAPYELGRKLAEAWCAELVTTEGLGHNRVLVDPEVVARVAGFAGGSEAPAGGRMEPSES